jgi:hypothetical protein
MFFFNRNIGPTGQFSAFFTIFCETIGFFLKNQCYDPLFVEFSSVLNKNPKFFADFFGENTFKKIITSFPGSDGHDVPHDAAPDEPVEGVQPHHPLLRGSTRWVRRQVMGPIQ